MELIARVRVVLKRCGYKDVPRVINSGGVTLDPTGRIAITGNERIDFSPKEFDLLYVLVSHPNQVLSRYALLDEVWGDDSDVTTRTIDAHVSYIRRKIEVFGSVTGKIETVYKAGYMWSLHGDCESGV
jgi:DNA-binding response OmpR family regulator